MMKNCPRILLASGSPRRRELLNGLGLEFEVVKPDVDESPLPGEEPEAMCVRLSALKANAVCAGDEDIVIAADTTVVIDGRSLGKPSSRDEARSMLRMLQGREHTVITGVAVRRGAETASCAERTAVRFRSLSDDEIRAYTETGECDDKAGAYAVQGVGSLLIAGITGDYFNVVGLPLCRLSEMLAQFGVGLETIIRNSGGNP